MEFQKDSPISCQTNFGYLANLKSEIIINNLNKLIILLFPFATFFGPYFSIFGINISNIFSLVLVVFVFNNLLKMRYSKIAIYVSFFFFMLLYALASLMWGKYSSVGLTIIFPLATCFTAMLYISGFNEKELELFLKSLGAFTFIALMMSLFEIFTGKYMFFNNIDFIYTTNNYGLNYPGVIFTNINDLAQYLLVGFPLIWLILYERKKQIIVSFLLLLITVFVLINTLSRLSIIAMFISVVFYFFVYKFTQTNKVLRILLALYLGVCLIFSLPFLGLDIFNTDILDNFLKVDISQTYFTIRGDIYNRVLELGMDNFLFGSGLGGSYVASIMAPHNMFLFIFGDLGLLWATGFFIILASAFMWLFKYKNVKVCGYYLGSTMLAILTIFPIFLSISSGNEQQKIVWIALGLIFATISNYKLNDSDLS